MMKIFVEIASILLALEMATCKPSAGPSDTITRDIKVELPGSERINRRSVDYLETSAAIPSDIPADDDSQEQYDDSAADYYSADASPAIVEREAPFSSEDIIPAESNIVFHPLFASRKRSLEKKRTSRSVNADDQDEMDAAENGMVFMPLFRSKNRLEEKQRFRRSAGLEDMDVAENGMVFMPLFRSKNRLEEKQRLRRAVDAVENADDMETAENGMVFLPLFRSKDRSELRRRLRRSPSKVADDLEVAEDLVFKPVFRRRFRPARSVTNEEIINGDVEAMDLAENGLIFRPLFRSKQRDI